MYKSRGIISGYFAAFLSVFLIAQFSCDRKTAPSGAESANKKYLSLREGSGSKFGDYFSAGRKIALDLKDEIQIGPKPSIGALSRRGEFIILDSFGVRQILVFDTNGIYKTRIGSQGTGEGQYLYPDNMFLDQKTGRVYVSDGDLLRILEYDEDYRYLSEIALPVYIEQLLVTKEGRFFCFTSGSAGPDGADRVVYEFDRTGRIKNSFLRMPKTFVPAAEAKGGGMVHINDMFYIITPYEYTINRCNASGKVTAQVRIKTPFYTEMKMYADKKVETDLNERKRYHSTWSHIWWIINIGKDCLGVVYNEAGTKRYYLDIFTSDLDIIAHSILLPNLIATPHAIHTAGNDLYWLEYINSDGIENIAIAKYSFRYLHNSPMPVREEVETQ